MAVTLTLFCDDCHTSASMERSSVADEAEAFTRAFTKRHGNCLSPPKALPSHSTLPFDDIVDAVSKNYGIDASAIKGSSRVATVVAARSMAMYLCRKLRGNSYPEIGTYFDRDHTTVIAACKKVEGLLDRQPAEGTKTASRHAHIMRDLGMTMDE